MVFSLVATNVASSYVVASYFFTEFYYFSTVVFFDPACLHLYRMRVSC